MKFVVCMDIGGTSLKTGIVGESGALAPGSLHAETLDSRGSAQSILSAFADALRSSLAFASTENVPVAGIGIAICGPFDCEKGISLIRGVGKYEALYGVDVKSALRSMTGLADDLPLFFDIDSWCFARGEVWYGAGAGFERVIVLTLGSGLGSAFSIHRRIVAEGPGVPWLGWIAGQRYRDGILNDYICRDAMCRRYTQLSGLSADVAEIARAARGGDEPARQVFEETGSALGFFLREHNVRDFGAECLIFGGRISLSFDLFAPSLQNALGRLPCLRATLEAADIECSALKGAARYVFEHLS